MNEHPNNETWMEFAYGELDASGKRAVQQHLQACAECREKYAHFWETKESLDAWRISVPARHELTRSWMPAIKWAAAAAILVTTAFATGRFSRPELDMEQVQARLTQPIQEHVRRELDARLQSELEAMRAQFAASQERLEKIAETLATLREEDQLELYASLERLETQHAIEYRKLRESLETVALLTDQSLKDAQRKIVQLAGFTTPQSY